MQKTRVLLTIQQQLHAQLLKHALATAPELELIGETTNVIECVTLIASQKADLWIHSWDEGPELTALLSHVYGMCPGLGIIRVNPKEPAGFIQLPVNSMSDLLKLAVRSRQWSKAA